MRKILVIAVREFQAAVRTKTFVISLVIMPIMACSGLIAALLLRNHANLADKRFAVIDRTGRLGPGILDAVEAHNRKVETDTDSSAPKPRFVIDLVDPPVGEGDDFLAELSDRVRATRLGGFVEIGVHAFDAPADAEERTTAAVYYSNNPMYGEFRDWIAGPINDAVRQWRMDTAGLSPDLVDWATQPVAVEQAALFERGPDGVVTSRPAREDYIHLAAAVGLPLLMFMVILVGAMPLTYSVLEEKLQRSAEMLLGVVTPYQLMMGKLLGMVGVALSIVTIYLVIGFAAATLNGYGHLIPRHLLTWFVLYEAGAILMYGSIYVAIGAACADMKDAQNLMTPASLIACIPLFVIRPVMLEPNSTFSTLVSFFPPATPILMMLRKGLPTPVPAWQPVAGLILVILTAILSVAIAARVFRVGILLQGQGASLGEMLRWALPVRRRPPFAERRHAAPIAL